MSKKQKFKVIETLYGPYSIPVHLSEKTIVRVKAGIEKYTAPVDAEGAVDLLLVSPPCQHYTGVHGMGAKDGK